MQSVRYPATSLNRLSLPLLLLTCLISACAEFDQIMKPRVEGLQKAPGFNGSVLVEGGIGEVHARSGLHNRDININVLETLLITAIRKKRPDVPVSHQGRYNITADILANDVSKRSDNLDDHIYRWTKRRVKVNYIVIDASTDEEVWSGTIDTSLEELASYETGKQKSSDKVIDAVVAAINKEEVHPYPSPPQFTDTIGLNFEGFALNLPVEK